MHAYCYLFLERRFCRKPNTQLDCGKRARPQLNFGAANNLAAPQRLAFLAHYNFSPALVSIISARSSCCSLTKQPQSSLSIGCAGSTSSGLTIASNSFENSIAIINQSRLRNNKLMSHSTTTTTTTMARSGKPIATARIKLVSFPLNSNFDLDSPENNSLCRPPEVQACGLGVCLPVGARIVSALASADEKESSLWSGPST